MREPWGRPQGIGRESAAETPEAVEEPTVLSAPGGPPGGLREHHAQPISGGDLLSLRVSRAVRAVPLLASARPSAVIIPCKLLQIDSTCCDMVLFLQVISRMEIHSFLPPYWG